MDQSIIGLQSAFLIILTFGFILRLQRDDIELKLLFIIT